jgi:hypothetical protein
VVDEPRGYPLVMVWADMPRLGAWHAEAVLGDLEAGTDVAIGPTLDGELYLLALAADQPAILAAMPDRHAVFEAAGEASLYMGLLRPERAARTAEDRRALLVDPLLPPEVREALSAAG